MIRRAQEGDLQARNAAVMANTRLVAAMAERVAPGQDLDDFIQVGIAGHGPGDGLINAIMTFDLSRVDGDPRAWGHYAGNGIMSAMLALLPHAARQVTSRRHNADQRKIRVAASRLPADASAAEVAASLVARGSRCTEADVESALTPPSRVRPEVSDAMGSAEESERIPDRERLMALLAALEPEQRNALAKKFGLGRSKPAGRLSRAEEQAAALGEAQLRELMLLEP